MKAIVLLAVSACCAASVLLAQDAQHPRGPSVKVVQGGEPAQDYGQAVELSDGSIWAVYIHTGGHATEDARTEALWSIRLRVGHEPEGIELLPAPGT